MFLIDKYTPKNIKDITFHSDIYKLLELISKDNELPHLIFYGPTGVGKKTMINIFLEMLFDASIHNSTEDVIYNVMGSGNKIIKEVIKQSNYHIVLEPKGNNFDRYLIHDVIKLYAKRIPLGIYETNRKFKLVVINCLDNLSNYAQFSLRRTMEKFSGTCRFIMCCESLSKVIDPLVSRCECIRVRAPTNYELMKYISEIAVYENIKLSVYNFLQIQNTSNGNIKNALWNLQFYQANQLVLKNIRNSIDNFIGATQKHIIISNQTIEYIEKIFVNIVEMDSVNKYSNKKATIYVNNIINVMYQLVIDVARKYTTQYNSALKSAEDFLQLYSKKSFKKIFKTLELEKGNKLDCDLDTMRESMNNILIFIEYLDIRNNFTKAVTHMANIILKKDCSLIIEIRTIAYNLLKTNIKPTDIMTELLLILLENKKLSDNVKYEIADIIAESEYKITNGRREIIHIDFTAVSIIDILCRNK